MFGTLKYIIIRILSGISIKESNKIINNENNS